MADAGNILDGEISAADQAKCDLSIFCLDADEAEFISVGIDANAPEGMPVILWLTSASGDGVGAVRMSMERARKVAAELLALSSDA